MEVTINVMKLEGEIVDQSKPALLDSSVQGKSISTLLDIHKESNPTKKVLLKFKALSCTKQTVMAHECR